jgi:cytochrome c-type biogenesis protein CcmH/NrfF
LTISSRADLACDVRDDYREMLEDGVPDEEAVQRLLDTYAQALTDVDGR